MTQWYDGNPPEAMLPCKVIATQSLLIALISLSLSLFSSVMSMCAKDEAELAGTHRVRTPAVYCCTITLTLTFNFETSKPCHF